MWQNQKRLQGEDEKTQNVKILKNIYKLNKPQNLNCDKTQKLRIRPNPKIENVTKLQNSICDQSYKSKI